MATPFELFVDAELPLRPSTKQDPLTLVAGQIPLSTGVGLELEFRDLTTITQPISEELLAALAVETDARLSSELSLRADVVQTTTDLGSVRDQLQTQLNTEATARAAADADIVARLAVVPQHTHTTADVSDFADSVVAQLVNGTNITLDVNPTTKQVTISAISTTHIATGNETRLPGDDASGYLVQVGDGVGGLLGIPQPLASNLVLTSNEIGIPSWEPAQTSGGTVTSVDIRGGTTGLVATGGPVTTEGIFQLDGVLAVRHGGTGGTTVLEILQNILPPQDGLTGAALFTDGTNVNWQLIPGNIYTPGIGLTANGNEFNSIVTVADGIAGRVPVTVGDGTLTNLLPGELGHVLTSAGDGVPPTWQPVKGTVSNIRIQNSAQVGLQILGGDPTDPPNPNATQITTTGTLSLGGVLSVTNGGTGAASITEALTNLLPSQDGQTGKFLGTTGTVVYWSDVFPTQDASTAGKFLYSDGAIVSWRDAASQAITSINGSRIGLTFDSRVDDPTTVDAGGVLQLLHGGTGATNAADALLALLPSQQDQTGKLLGSVNGLAQWVSAGAGTVTSVAIDGGSTGLNFNGGPITDSGTFHVGGVLSIQNGGTGANTAINAIRALLPDQTDQTGKILTTDGTTISWTTAAAGSVTSVEVSGGTTGLNFDGGAITSSGVLTLGGVLNIANGGTGSSSLTELQRIVLPAQLNNGGKILTTDGTTASWAPGGSVSSVNASGGATGLNFSGGPITGAGTLTLSGTLAIANGGTGGNSALSARTNILPPQASNAGFVLTTNGTDVSWVNPATAMNYAAGSTGQLQFNNGNSLAASSGLTWNSGTSTLSATSFSGVGSALTALNASNLTTGTVAVARLGTGVPSATTVLKGNGVWTAVYDPKYDLALSITGKPAANAYVLNFCVVNPFTLPAGLAGSVAKSNSAATGTATFTIYKNGSTVGTIAFAPGSTTGAFTFSALQSFAAGDFIQIIAPATQDTTLANIGFTLKGTLTA